MPGRRKKAEEGGAPAASEAAVTDEAFKELIKQAASGVGAGRGRGRGRFGQQRFQVTFGGFGDDRECGGRGGRVGQWHRLVKADGDIRCCLMRGCGVSRLGIVAYMCNVRGGSDVAYRLTKLLPKLLSGAATRR